MQLQQTLNLTQLKHVLIQWLTKEPFKNEDLYRKQIADQFGAPFVYKDTVFQGTSFKGLPMHLPTDKWEEFEMHYQELQEMQRFILIARNHVINYLNQCRTRADCLALLPDCLLVRFNKETRIATSTKPTINVDTVKAYQDAEVFQQLVDRIVILGDL